MKTDLHHSDSKAHTILVIDDEIQICAMIATILEIEGYTVLTAYDGEEGLSQIQTYNPDLIICDRAMHGMSGEELLSDLRNNYPQHNDIPFIFMSALTRKEHHKATEHLRPYAYLDKPADFPQMLRSIEGALNQYSPFQRV